MNPNGSRDPDLRPDQCQEEHHVPGCPGAAGGDHEPDPAWFEDEDGWVMAPLSYENREGDPAFNGAFDKW